MKIRLNIIDHDSFSLPFRAVCRRFETREDSTRQPGKFPPWEKVPLIVEDKGPGVPTASIPHIFKPFYRVEGD